MNPEAVHALRQARGYYVEGASQARKRVRELTEALEEARGQVTHADRQVAALTEALEDAGAGTEAAS